MATIVETVQSSELSRNSLSVFKSAEAHPVVVTRRDGENLVLMSEREASSQTQLLELAAQLIAVTTDTDGPLHDRMAERFPWMYALDPVARAQCAQELVDAARASFATKQLHLVIQQLTAWRETATAIAAGLGSEPVDWVDLEFAVTRPE
jgi:PHD/YefM family antitoxin component YafN of YafNO toxin-antitoxin module